MGHAARLVATHHRRSLAGHVVAAIRLARQVEGPAQILRVPLGKAQQKLVDVLRRSVVPNLAP